MLIQKSSEVSKTSRVVLKFKHQKVRDFCVIFKHSEFILTFYFDTKFFIAWIEKAEGVGNNSFR